ncbi:MAG: NAD-dependent epimerase/dehydratase family protein [Ilumatobacter sp.]
MRVFVTGASSLIGAGVVQRLVTRGDRVATLQRRRAPGLPDVVEQHLGDVADADVVQRAIEGCDGMIHLAAKVGVVGDRSDYASTNVEGTRNVLDAARRHGVQRVVHVSSPSVAHDGTPIIGGGADTALRQHGSAWYPETKAIAEELALDANDGHTAVTVIRPHLVWGPGDTQLVGRIAERAAQGRLALVGGGAALVDTTYIDNATSVLVAAIDAVGPGERCAGRAYVVSNGEPRPIRELVEGICLAAGVPFAPRDVPLAAARRIGSVIDRAWPRLGRTDEPPLTRFLADQLGTAHWFDPRPVRDDLGWAPEVSIDDGLAELASWFDRSGRRGSDSR